MYFIIRTQLSLVLLGKEWHLWYFLRLWPSWPVFRIRGRTLCEGWFRTLSVVCTTSRTLFQACTLRFSCLRVRGFPLWHYHPSILQFWALRRPWPKRFCRLRSSSCRKPWCPWDSCRAQLVLRKPYLSNTFHVQKLDRHPSTHCSQT